MKKLLTSITLVFSIFVAPLAQVTTNLNNTERVSNKGKFSKEYKTEIDFEIAQKDLKALTQTEMEQSSLTTGDKPFRLAVANPININIVNKAKWKFEGDYAFTKFTLKLKGALSTSINFDEFYLPPNTELFIYSENGEMLTGPVTERENNSNKIWGSWVYKGEYLTIEIKTPIKTKKNLLLHANNVGYGYKHVYKETGGFGNSEGCNINVICPLGTGWESERNSVALVLNHDGESWCSGAMIMNTCSSTRPFFLTANHFHVSGLESNLPKSWQ